MKRCSTCKKLRVPGEFFKNRNAHDGPGNQCKGCHTKSARPSYYRNRETRIRQSENARKLRSYGLTQLQYDGMLEAQGGCCAICLQPERARDGTTGKTRRLSVDHCQKTGVVGGLLCSACNLAIGLVGDDIAALARAIEYLSAPRPGK